MFLIKKPIKTIILDVILIILGSGIYALSFDMLLRPYDIAPAGVSGLALIFHTLTGLLSIGTLVIIMNIPLFLLSLKHLGKRFVIYSLIGTLALSGFIDLFAAINPFETEPFLAAIFGGVCNGAGIGLVFVRGATTGGVDIAVRLIKMKLPYLSIGRIVLVMDILVVSLAGVVFHSINSSLYAIIVIYVSTVVMDGVIYGFDTDKVVYIISNSCDEITRRIEAELDRGVTHLYGRGAYSGEEKSIILCAIKPFQIAMLKDLVQSVDKNAFVIMTEAHEVLGSGFSVYNKHGL